MDPVVVAADVGALVAAALALVGALPQLANLARTGDTAGVPLAAATLGLASELAWLAYNTNASLWSAMPSSAALAVTHTILGVLLVVHRVPVVRPLLLGTLWGSMLVAATVLGGWTVLGTVLPVAYGAQLLPSVWTAWRTPTPSGVSLLSWLSILVESLLWGAYGLIHRDPANTMFAVVGVVASSLVVLRLAVTAPRISYARALARPDLLSGLVVLGHQLGHPSRSPRHPGPAEVAEPPRARPGCGV